MVVTTYVGHVWKNCKKHNFKLVVYGFRDQNEVYILCVFHCRWQELIRLTEERKRMLKGAEQVHRFVRDASETNDRMNEKVWR